MPDNHPENLDWLDEIAQWLFQFTRLKDVRDPSKGRVFDERIAHCLSILEKKGNINAVRHQADGDFAGKGDSFDGCVDVYEHVTEVEVGDMLICVRYDGDTRPWIVRIIFKDANGNKIPIGSPSTSKVPVAAHREEYVPWLLVSPKLRNNVIRDWIDRHVVDGARPASGMLLRPDPNNDCSGINHFGFIQPQIQAVIDMSRVTKKVGGAWSKAATKELLDRIDCTLSTGVKKFLKGGFDCQNLSELAVEMQYGPFNPDTALKRREHPNLRQYHRDQEGRITNRLVHLLEKMDAGPSSYLFGGPCSLPNPALQIRPSPYEVWRMIRIAETEDPHSLIRYETIDGRTAHNPATQMPISSTLHPASVPEHAKAIDPQQARDMLEEQRKLQEKRLKAKPPAYVWEGSRIRMLDNTAPTSTTSDIRQQIGALGTSNSSTSTFATASTSRTTIAAPSAFTPSSTPSTQLPRGPRTPMSAAAQSASATGLYSTPAPYVLRSPEGVAATLAPSPRRVPAPPSYPSMAPLPDRLSTRNAAVTSTDSAARPSVALRTPQTSRTPQLPTPTTRPPAEAK